MERQNQRRLAGFDEQETADAVGRTRPGARKSPSPPAGDHADIEPPSAAAPKSTPPPDLTGRSVYVVDAHSLIYQVFHALPEMSSPTGQPVGAVHGFMRDILTLLARNPDYLFCAFDFSGVTFRHSMYDQYKVARESMPLDLRPQMQSIRRLLEALSIPILEVPNFEADDILATLAAQTESAGGECFLVTGDKDCRQLITQRVKIYNIRKNLFFDTEALQQEWGIRPDQVVDFQAMVGDSIDNIPGIPLIGPKLARDLLQKYGTLDNILDHAGEISGTKRRENLLAARNQALLSRDLVRLDPQTPVAVDWDAGRVGGIDHPQVQQLCREFGFRRLAEDFSKLTVAAEHSEWSASYQAVLSLSDLDRVVTELGQARRFALATYIDDHNPRWSQITGLALACCEGQGYYVPITAGHAEPGGAAGTAPTALPLDEVLERLRPLLEDPSCEKIGHNLQFDMVVLRSAGVALRGAMLDTTVADYLLNPGERNHGVDELAQRYLNHTSTRLANLLGTGKQQKRLHEIPVEQAAQYTAEAADIAWRATDLLRKRLAAEGLDKLFHQVEMPLLEVLAELQYNGIRLDTDLLKQLGERLGERMEELEQEIYELAGEIFKIDSRLQLASVLFNRLGLPVLKKTKTGPSTDAEVLADLAKNHPLPAKILEYRHNAKLKSTYVDALPLLVNPRTGRVHTSFKQDVAATGRLSSQDPNLQNIPVRSDEGRQIRAAFLPAADDWVLLAADYSQIELRVLAHFSGDAALQRAFQQDQDIHALVAGEIHGVPMEQVTAEMRRRAKTINFGVIYGLSPFGLAKALQIDTGEAATFIDAYFQRYVGVSEFIEDTLEECRKAGYVSTILGRRRAVQGVRDAGRRVDSRQRNLPERIAVNTVIQGSAADLIKLAMIDLRRQMQQEDLQARMLLQIHDELIFEVPANEISRLASLVTERMTQVGPLAVPLKVDLKTGKNWAECEPWDGDDPPLLGAGDA